MFLRANIFRQKMLGLSNMNIILWHGIKNRLLSRILADGLRGDDNDDELSCGMFDQPRPYFQCHCCHNQDLNPQTTLLVRNLLDAYVQDNHIMVKSELTYTY